MAIELGFSCWPTQVPRELYEFPGYPYPDAKMKEIAGKSFGEFPQGPEVAEYIRMFADDMELQQHISFQTSVTRLEPIAGGDGWAMHHGKQGEAEVVEQFDFVVVATGMYASSNAHLPTAEGMDRFQGKIMHSCQFTDASVCQGKNVVVVGGGKSSIDCVVAAAKKGAKAASQVSNLLYRLLSIYLHSYAYSYDITVEYFTFTYAGRLSGLPRRALAGAA